MRAFKSWAPQIFLDKSLWTSCDSFKSTALEPLVFCNSFATNAVVPCSKLKSYSDHAFSVAAPRLWNDRGVARIFQRGGHTVSNIIVI